MSTNQTNEDKMLGAMFPGDMVSFLSLYALYTGQTRSRVLRHAVTFWKANVQVLEKDLVSWAKEQLHAEWAQLPAGSITVEEFTQAAAERFKHRGVSEETVKLITKDFAS